MDGEIDEQTDEWMDSCMNDRNNAHHSFNLMIVSQKLLLQA